MNASVEIMMPKDGMKVVLFVGGSLNGSFVKVPAGASEVSLHRDLTIQELIAMDTSFDGTQQVRVTYHVEGLVKVKLNHGQEFEIEAFYERRSK